MPQNKKRETGPKYLIALIKNLSFKIKYKINKFVVVRLSNNLLQIIRSWFLLSKNQHFQ